MTHQKSDPSRFISISEAADILDCSYSAVQQLILRKKITARKVLRNVQVLRDDVIAYRSKKTGIPALETADFKDLSADELISMEEAASLMMVALPYVRLLVKNKTLKGYIRTDGHIVLSRRAVDNRLFKGTTSVAEL
jgi:excisionase family DNA binding protein